MPRATTSPPGFPCCCQTHGAVLVANAEFGNRCLSAYCVACEDRVLLVPAVLSSCSVAAASKERSTLYHVRAINGVVGICRCDTCDLHCKSLERVRTNAPMRPERVGVSSLFQYGVSCVIARGRGCVQRPHNPLSQAMLINSADLMGGNSEPDGFRGFGRVHLEAGMPLDGLGDMSLFVVDAAEVEMQDYTINEYEFELNPDTELELRATLAWIDPPVSPDASIQLLHDLDLTVVAPDGTLYRMFSDGADDRNVVERVIVPASDVGAASGTWTVAVSCLSLSEDVQAYSLVVTGPIVAGSGAVSTREASAAVGNRGPGFLARFVTAATTVLIATFAGCAWLGGA